MAAIETPSTTKEVVHPESLIKCELIADKLGFPIADFIFPGQYFTAAGACWRALNRWESTLRCNATHNFDVRTEGISNRGALASLVNAKVPRLCCKVRIANISDGDSCATTVFEPPRFPKHLVTIKVRSTVEVCHRGFRDLFAVLFALVDVCHFREDENSDFHNSFGSGRLWAGQIGRAHV